MAVGVDVSGFKTVAVTFLLVGALCVFVFLWADAELRLGELREDFGSFQEQVGGWGPCPYGFEYKVQRSCWDAENCVEFEGCVKV